MSVQVWTTVVPTWLLRGPSGRAVVGSLGLGHRGAWAVSFYIFFCSFPSHSLAFLPSFYPIFSSSSCYSCPRRAGAGGGQQGGSSLQAPLRHLVTRTRRPRSLFFMPLSFIAALQLVVSPQTRCPDPRKGVVSLVTAVPWASQTARGACGRASSSLPRLGLG